MNAVCCLLPPLSCLPPSHVPVPSYLSSVSVLHSASASYIPVIRAACRVCLLRVLFAGVFSFTVRLCRRTKKREIHAYIETKWGFLPFSDPWFVMADGRRKRHMYPLHLSDKGVFPRRMVRSRPVWFFVTLGQMIFFLLPLFHFDRAVRPSVRPSARALERAQSPHVATCYIRQHLQVRYVCCMYACMWVCRGGGAIPVLYTAVGYVRSQQLEIDTETGSQSQNMPLGGRGRYVCADRTRGRYPATRGGYVVWQMADQRSR